MPSLASWNQVGAGGCWSADAQLAVYLCGPLLALAVPPRSRPTAAAAPVTPVVMSSRRRLIGRSDEDMAGSSQHERRHGGRHARGHVAAGTASPLSAQVPGDANRFGSRTPSSTSSSPGMGGTWVSEGAGVTESIRSQRRPTRPGCQEGFLFNAAQAAGQAPPGPGSLHPGDLLALM